MEALLRAVVTADDNDDHWELSEKMIEIDALLERLEASR